MSVNKENFDDFLGEFSAYTSVYDHINNGNGENDEQDEWIRQCYGRGKTFRKDFRAHLSGYFLSKCSGDNGEHSFDNFKYVFMVN